VLQDGVAHIAINHAEDDGSTDERRFHRILSSVPAADIQPPESVPNVQLQGVRFTMDLLKPKQRSQIRRSNTLPIDTDTRQPKGEDGKNESHDILLHEMAASLVSSDNASSHATPTMSRKRKRAETQAPTWCTSSPLLSSVREARPSRRPVVNTALHIAVQDTLTEELVAEIHSMVDAAVRLSVYGINKSSTGIKVKANTFSVGLADIAPVLWRPGYLAVGEEI
jgi:hypothetical protein